MNNYRLIKNPSFPARFRALGGVVGAIWGVMGVIGAGVIQGQTPVVPEYARIVHSDFQRLQQFGKSVAISGDTAVIMLSRRQNPDSITPRQWAARVLDFNGLNWVEGPLLLGALSASGLIGGILRPNAVAIDGDLIALGEIALFTHDPLPGEPEYESVHLFRFDGEEWDEEEILTPPDNDRNDWFGTTIAIQGDLIAIGAPRDSHGPDAQQVGSVYMYRFDSINWVEEAKILPPGDWNPGEMFGLSVAIQGNELFVGAPNDILSNTPGTGGGRVFVFHQIGADWILKETLIPSDSEDLDRFGASIAVNGTVLIIGAYGDEHDSIPDAGSVYVFSGDGVNWREEAKLTASDGSERDGFGYAVDVHGSTILVGAPGKDTEMETQVGTAYVFRGEGTHWAEVSQSIPTDPLHSFLFMGNSVALSDTRMLVGAASNKIITNCPEVNIANHGGAVYLYAHDCNGNGVFDLTETMAGQVEDCNGNFVPDDCEDCNNNGVVDRDDILNGVSTDCNANCLPDDCELAECNTPLDCNGNGIIDSCDIASGTSQDLNGNGVPDECDIQIFPDNCALPIPGVTLGTTPISTFAATTDGFSESCGQFESDVWLNAISLQSCFMTISVCDANFPAELAVYGSNCPDGPNQALACSNNTCGTNTSITFPAPGFTSHLIRIGGTNGQRGTGNLVISCSTIPPCHGDITPPGGNGAVNIDDLVAVLSAFGPCPPPEGATCDADLFPITVSNQGDGIVDAIDLVILISNFGPCQ